MPGSDRRSEAGKGRAYGAGVVRKEVDLISRGLGVRNRDTGILQGLVFTQIRFPKRLRMVMSCICTYTLDRLGFESWFCYLLVV